MVALDRGSSDSATVVGRALAERDVIILICIGFRFYVRRRGWI